MTIRKKFTLTFPANKNIPPALGNHHHLSATRFSDYAQKSCDNKGVNYGQWRSVRYVITVMLHEDTLTEINELNNYLTRDGFCSMTDDEGNIHELGTNTFGLISTQSEEEIRELVSGLPKCNRQRS
ncbi:type V toxin-antitoxin system endoribonuclease antitoxin GhoS [Escherichia coli]